MASMLSGMPGWRLRLQGPFKAASIQTLGIGRALTFCAPARHDPYRRARPAQPARAKASAWWVQGRRSIALLSITFPQALYLDRAMVGTITQSVDASPELRTDGEAACIFLRGLSPNGPGVRVQPASIGKVARRLLTAPALEKTLCEPEMRMRPGNGIIGEPQPRTRGGGIVCKFARRSFQRPVTHGCHVDFLGAITLGDLFWRHLQRAAVHVSERVRGTGIFRRPHNLPF